MSNTILVLTGFVLFFVYMCYKGRAAAGKLTFRASITTGLPGTGTGSVSNDGGRDGPAPNSRTSHPAGAQQPTTATSTNISGAHRNTTQGQNSTQANAPPVTSNTTNNGASGTRGNLHQRQNQIQAIALLTTSNSTKGASGTHGNLPQSQTPTQQGAPQLNSSNIHAGSTDTRTGPSEGPSTFNTGASHDTSSDDNSVGINYRNPNGRVVQVPLGYDESLFGIFSH
ncbi:MAG: hypothetical protein L6R42_005692 [Xanthoria sp. 1 TBL-2021]|nr:MAG: hypothetical protein L6R42_005692 [Xanthoria sp. 1 TBL-2021]